MNAWRVGLICNMKKNVQAEPEAPPDALAEYDSVETVQALKEALQAGGHQVTRLEADETLLDSVRQVAPDICFNIAEGLRGDARESHVPALLEMLGIPYTASKVLGHAISLDKAATKRIKLPEVKTVMPPERASQPPATMNSPMLNKPAREISPEVVAWSMP